MQLQETFIIQFLCVRTTIPIRYLLLSRILAEQTWKAQCLTIGNMLHYQSRYNWILDHFYCKVKEAYKSVSRSCCGDAGHATIMLIPICRQQLKRCKSKTKTVNAWMPEAIERLQDCFGNTDWNVFKEGNNLHTFTETVTAYIKFCQRVCIPS